MTVAELIKELQQCHQDSIVLGADYRGSYEVDTVNQGSMNKKQYCMDSLNAAWEEWDDSTWKKDNHTDTRVVLLT